MSEQIKELIAKINQEGVQAAQEKAGQIEAEAKAKAKMILDQAEAKSKAMLEEAGQKILRLQASSEAALKQAARDALLCLKKEIADTLQKVIAAEIGAAMTPEELARMITELAKARSLAAGQETVVFLSEKDKHRLESHFLDQLKQELKKGLVLRPQEDIQAGLAISFDSGKSQFDFTDQALAEYLSAVLKSGIAALFKDIK
jgi:V/A-type H+-transporting ATPase subunit E